MFRGISMSRRGISTQCLRAALILLIALLPVILAAQGGSQSTAPKPTPTWADEILS